jgi:hypothetical protein
MPPASAPGGPSCERTADPTRTGRPDGIVAGGPPGSAYEAIPVEGGYRITARFSNVGDLKMHAPV